MSDAEIVSPVSEEPVNKKSVAVADSSDDESSSVAAGDKNGFGNDGEPEYRPRKVRILTIYHPQFPGCVPNDS